MTTFFKKISPNRKRGSFLSTFSVRIILSLLLAVLLWSGVATCDIGRLGINLYPQENKTGALFGIKMVSAATPAEMTADCSNRFPNNPSGFAACMATAFPSEDEGFWAPLFSAIGDATGTLLKGAAGVVLNMWGAILSVTVMPISAVIMRLAGYLLDKSTLYTLNSANLTNVNGAITTVWVLVRNVFNITFIFILLYVAIKTIIGSSSANTKKMIAQVIIAALLINFSLFFTRILIDAGNILAVNLYNLATNNGQDPIGSVIMQWGNISALFNTETVSILLTPTDSAFFIIIILQIIMLWIAIVVFFYVALMFLIRNVMLIFLMAISPIGFMGNILPKIEEYSKMWWENLFGQIMIAPVFFLFFYLIYQIQSQLSGAIESMSLNSLNLISDPNANNDRDYTIYFKYIMIIVLLVVAVKMAKKLSGEAGKFITKIGNIIVAAAVVGVTLGAGAMATGGAAMAAKGAERITTGNAMKARGGLAGNRVIKSGEALKKAGERREAIGNVLSGEKLRNVAATAGVPGLLARGLSTGGGKISGYVKQQTGLDLGLASKWLPKGYKGYQEAEEGRIATGMDKLGGAKQQEQLKTLQDIDKNIKNQATTRAMDQTTEKHKQQIEDAKKLTDKSEQTKELEKIKKQITTEAAGLVDGLKEVVAGEMGVNIKDNEAKMETLQKGLITSNQRRNEAIKKIKAPVLSNKLRAMQLGAAKDNTEAKKFMKDFEKMLKKSKEGGGDEPEAEKPKEEPTPMTPTGETPTK